MAVKACVLRTDGINCDSETKYAFELAGAKADIVHIKSLIKGSDPATGKSVGLEDYDILAIPGGFSYGDSIAAGKVFAQDLKYYLQEQITDFAKDGRLIIGICNGFQALVKYGLLPGVNGEAKQTEKQTTTLTANDNQRFECRWSDLIKPDYKTQGEKDKCVWTKGIDSIYLPVAHGEGKFVADEGLVKELFDNGQVVFRYADSEGNATMEHPANPNGSVSSIAGICDPTGKIFGLMPHPERYNCPGNHPLAGLQKITGSLPKEGLGIQIFRNGVEAVK